MIVAVGSKNPTKIDPVKQVFSHYFKNVSVVGVSADSKVSDQPLHIDEMYTGALNRAKSALKQVKRAEYGVGIEGGLHKYSYGWLENSLIVVVNKKGDIGVGASSGLVMPDKIMEEIHKGNNLEQAVDKLFKTKKIGQSIGMFGIMTKKLITRSEGVRHGIAFALARFHHKGVYT